MNALIYPHLSFTPSSPGVDTTSTSQSFASRYLPHLPSSSYLHLDNPQLQCMSVPQSGADRQECITNHPLSCPRVSDFPNPFSSGSQQPVALSPSNPFSNAAGGEALSEAPLTLSHVAQRWEGKRFPPLI